VEAHVLNFKGDLYDRDIRVHFVQRIRSERKFESLEALRERIAADIVLAGRILEEPEAHPAGTAYASGPATDSGGKGR